MLYLNALAVLAGEAPGSLGPLFIPPRDVPLPPQNVAIGEPASIVHRRQTSARVSAIWPQQLPVSRLRKRLVLRRSSAGIIGIDNGALCDLLDLVDIPKMSLYSDGLYPTWGDIGGMPRAAVKPKCSMGRRCLERNDAKIPGHREAEASADCWPWSGRDDLLFLENSQSACAILFLARVQRLRSRMRPSRVLLDLTRATGPGVELRAQRRDECQRFVKHQVMMGFRNPDHRYPGTAELSYITDRVRSEEPAVFSIDDRLATGS